MRIFRDYQFFLMLLMITGISAFAAWAMGSTENPATYGANSAAGSETEGQIYNDLEDEAMEDTSQYTGIATLGGGCFWCVEAVYEPIEGIGPVISGYAGGTVSNPSYEQVTSGRTGHAEVVQLSFDESRISYEQILRLFFKAHDPTTLNRQGYDVGTQYRSIILTHNPEQERIARQVIQDVQAEWSDPIVTEVKTFDAFYVAEAYHQDFYERNPNYGYCAAVIRPKLDKLGLEGVERIDILDMNL